MVTTGLFVNERLVAMKESGDSVDIDRSFDGIMHRVILVAYFELKQI